MSHRENGVERHDINLPFHQLPPAIKRAGLMDESKYSIIYET
jgi:hypothetical protein